MFRGDTIDEIRCLPAKNIYQHRLSYIEKLYDEHLIDEERALSMASDLVIEFCDKKKTIINDLLKTQKIFVIDSIMGSGKSTYILEKMIPSNIEERFLCVLPTLDECKRYRETLKDNIDFFVYEPIAKSGSKTKDLQDLIKRNANIVTTHALIQRIGQSTLNLLKERDYILIMDECLDVISEFNKKFTKSDLKDLEKLGYIHVDDKGFIIWDNQDNSYDGRYEDIKNLCDLKSLMLMKKKNTDSFSKSVLMWNFPIKFFEVFKKSFICTYLWNGSFQKAYFDLHKIFAMHMTLINGELTIYNPTKDLLLREDFRSLINLYEGNLNSIGEPDRKNKNPLSSSWYKSKAKDETLRKLYFEPIKKNTINYFKNKVKTLSSENMFTVYLDYEKYVRGDGYKKGFVAWNMKATNDHRDKGSLAYLINLYPQPDIINFFKSYGVEINQDMYSVSELLQWIWRSKIRDKQRINLFMPSARMRDLLKEWVLGKL